MAVLSKIIENGNLVTYEKWSSYIDSLKNRAVKKIEEEKEAVQELKQPFFDAVKNRIPAKRFGIFFSGGVDSTTIAFSCKKYTDNFVCYSVGLPGSKDIEWSSKIAKDIGFEHRKRTLNLKEMETLFERTAAIIKENLNVVNLGVGAVELAAIDFAKEDGVNVFFGGLGSEEIFAGYQRHSNTDDINKECWAGLKTTYERDFGRDVMMAQATGSTFLTPFLDKEVIVAAMNISGSLKIKEGYKKYIFRKLALDIGLKKEYAMRPKKAAQYGSSFDKAILKIAKSKGFRYKRQYIEFLKNKFM